MFDEQEPLHKIESPGGNPAGQQSPEAFETEVAAQLAAFKPIGGEIEVTPSALKLGMCIFSGLFSSGWIHHLADYELLLLYGLSISIFL